MSVVAVILLTLIQPFHAFQDASKILGFFKFLAANTYRCGGGLGILQLAILLPALQHTFNACTTKIGKNLGTHSP